MAGLAARQTAGEGIISTPRPTVLLVDDEPHSVSAMRMALEDEFDCVAAADAEAAALQMETQSVQVVVCDQRMPGRTGVELLTDLRERWPDTVRIIITGYTDPSAMAHAINQAGIHQFLTKPWHPEQLLIAVRNGAQLAQLARENARLALEMRFLASTAQTRLDMRRTALREKMSFETILRSPQSPMNAVIKAARLHASFDIPVLLTGESGVGRTRLAHAIHLASLRSDRPFVTVSLTGLPDEMAAIELFGVKRSTGAPYRYGAVKKADRGTVFIKGIEHAGAGLQLELLRFIEEGAYAPVGGQEQAGANVRIIAAAGPELARRVADGSFRQELYYALSVAEIAVPPLRARRGDVPILAQALLEELSAHHGKAAHGFTAAALGFLSNWDWPGNIKELHNEVTRMLVFAQAPVLGAELISRTILQAALPEESSDRSGDDVMTADGTLRDRVERIEMRILRETLTRLRWNKSRAAAELGLSRVGLRAKLDRYGIADPSGRVTEEEED